MKKFLLFVPSVFTLVLSIIIFTLTSCKDPVFYYLSEENEPIPPLIAGPSTKFVKFKEKIFVAAENRIYCYTSGDGNSISHTRGTWNLVYSGSRVRNIAATSKYLYVSFEGNMIQSYDISDSSPIKIVPAGFEYIPETIQGIYTVPGDNTLFIGTSVSNLTYNIYSIYYLNDDSILGPKRILSEEVTPEKGEKYRLPFSMLIGVASDSENYYLCNKDNAGIFKIPKADKTKEAALLPSTNYPGILTYNYTGIINLNSESIIAISRDLGRIYKVTSAGVTPAGQMFTSRSSTGALCVYNGKNAQGSYNLLLAGRQDMTNTTSSGYTHGYVEIGFNTETGNLSGLSFVEPGGIASSIIENTYGNYSTSIGKHGIRYMYQAPDGILFASLNEGVWSYREREPGKYTWNAEN